MKAPLTLVCVFILSIVTHAQKLKKGHDFFRTHDRVGLLIDTRVRAVTETGAGGTAAAALLGPAGIVAGGLAGGAFGATEAVINHSRPLNKYDSALQKIQPYVDPTELAKTTYKDIYTSKGKEVVMLDIDYNSVPDFARPNKKWPTKDVRTMQETYGINSLVHITLDYGMEIKMTYGIVTRKAARCRIITDIITTSGNMYIVHDVSTISLQKIEDGWNNPPDYTTLQTAVKLAIQEAIIKQKQIYSKL